MNIQEIAVTYINKRRSDAEATDPTEVSDPLVLIKIWEATSSDTVPEKQTEARLVTIVKQTTKDCYTTEFISILKNEVTVPYFLEKEVYLKAQELSE